MRGRDYRLLFWFLGLSNGLSLCLAQSFNSAISGLVTDPTEAPIVGAELTLTSVGTEVTANLLSREDGLYRFGNLARGVYDLKVSAKGFRDFVQRGIVLNINETVTVNVRMQLGAAVEVVKVTAEASPLNFV